MSNRPAYIHHVNFPTTDPDRTREWYTKVFGLKAINAKSNTRVVLMTRGDFDLHFTPVDEMDRMAPYHYAMEVEDWEGFMAHLAEVGVRHTRPIERPENNSKFCYIHDPDHTMIELVWHGNRPSLRTAGGAAPGAARTDTSAVSPGPAPAAAATSAEEAAVALDAADAADAAIREGV